VAGCVNTSLAFMLGASVPELHLLSSAMLIGFLGYGLSLVLFVTLPLNHVALSP